MPLILLSFIGSVLAGDKVTMKNSIEKSIEMSKKAKTITPLFSEKFKVIGIGLSQGPKA